MIQNQATNSLDLRHVITLTKDMSVGDWAKVCIQSVNRGEKLVMHPWSIVRIMHPANDIGRVRFYNKMLMMEEIIRGWDLNSFDSSLNSAKLESKIPTRTEKTLRRWPWWFRRTPPIREGPGLPREEPSTFHLKLLTIEGDHILTILIDWTLDHRIRPHADLSKSDGEYGKSDWIAFSHKHRRVIIRKKIVS